MTTRNIFDFCLYISRFLQQAKDKELITEEQYETLMELATDMVDKKIHKNTERNDYET